MKEINKPSEKRFWIAHNGTDFFVSGETDPGLVTTTGQGELEHFPTDQARDARLKSLANKMITDIQELPAKISTFEKMIAYNGDISKWDIKDPKSGGTDQSGQLNEKRK